MTENEGQPDGMKETENGDRIARLKEQFNQIALILWAVSPLLLTLILGIFSAHLTTTYNQYREQTSEAVPALDSRCWKDGIPTHLTGCELAYHPDQSVFPGLASGDPKAWINTVLVLLVTLGMLSIAAITIHQIDQRLRRRNL